MKFPAVYTDLCFKAGFRKYHDRPRITPPLACEQRELRVAADA
jgi:hypothetical protein